MSDVMKRELNGVKARLGGIDARLDGVETRLGGVDARLDGVEARLGGIESEARETKKILRNVVLSVTKMSTSLDEINSSISYMKDRFVTKEEFHGRMDAFIVKQDEMRFDWGQHRVRLENHDKRLTRLESRRD